MKTVRFLAGVALLAACSSDLPHEAPFDPNAPLEKQAKASLSGTVRLEGETDFSQVTLDLQNADRTYNVDTAADGAVSLTGIVPGVYTLKIRTRYFQPVTESLTVEMGATVELGTRVLPPLRSRVLGLATSEQIKGNELVTKGGVALSLRKTASVRAAVSKSPALRKAAAVDRDLLFSTLSGSDGDFEFPDVPAGGYELSAASDDAEERVVGAVTVTGEGDVTVDPIVLRPLTGYFEILGSANGVPSSTYTSIAAVNLQLQQSNAVQVKVAVSTNGTTTGCNLSTATAEALPSNTLRPLTFTSEGKKLVCVSYVDADGKETAPIYGTITYDATPPTLPSLAINGGAAVVSSNVVTLSLSAVDTGSGLASYKVGTATGVTATSAKPFQATDVYSLSGGEGLNTVWVVFGDHAGNYSAAVPASVLLDMTPPAPVGPVTLAKLDGTPLTSGDTIADSKVRLTTSVNEATPVLEMQITTNGSYAGQSWVPYDPAKTIDLPSGASSISVRMRDGAGHIVDLVTAFDLTTDTTPPTGTLVIAPTAVTDPAIMVQATGSVDAVAVELAFDPGFVTSLGNYVPGPIAVTLPAGDGTKTVYGRFFDAAGNSSGLVGDTVVLDTTPPQILSFTLAQVSPTKDNPVTVNYSAAGAAELRITEGLDCGGVIESIVAGTKTFTVSSSEGVKDIRLQFFDAAGNASECAVRTIYFDPNPPVIGALQINYGQAATSSNVVTMSFPGVSGATKVMVSEDAGFTGVNWDGFAPSKTFTLSPGNGVKTVYAKVADDAGHVVSLTQQTITLDTTPPSAPSIFAAVDVTSQTSVQLSLAAGLVSEMWITQDDPAFSTGAWETYSGSKLFSLSGADGTKTIYAKFKKSTGLETGVVSDTVILDRAAPTLPSVQINGGAAVVTSNIVTLNLSAVDAASGLATYKVNTINDFTSASPLPFQPTDVFSFAPGDGPKTVWITIGDRAGLYSAPVSATVLLDTTAPVVGGAVTVNKIDGTPLTTGGTLNENRVVVTSSVSDASGLQMQVSTNGSYSGVAWVPYEPNKVIDLGTGAASISVRVRDGAGLVTELITAFTLTVDTTPPTGTLDIAATAVTSPAIMVLAIGSIDAVTVELAYDPGFVTSLGNFVPGPIPVTLPAGDGARTVYGRFFDAAGNASTLVGDTVSLDTTPPQILSYTISQASPTKDNPITVNYNASGAAELRITEGADCGSVREPVGAGTLTLTLSASEGSKSLRLQFFDAAGNASECAVRTVYYDPNPPVVGTMQINYGQSATSSNVVTISFTGVSGATKVILSEDAGFAGADWSTYAPTKTFVLSTGNGVKTVYAKVADDAGHVVNVPQAAITLDTSAPTAPSIFAAYDVTTQTSVLLTLAAGVVQDMMLSQDDPSFSTATWEPYVGSKVFTLSGADGIKTIYAKFRKANLTETAVVSDTVILDRAAPTLPSVRVDGNVTVVASTSLVLNLSAVDAASGLQSYKINTVNDFSAVAAQPFQSTVLYGLSGPDGLKTVWVTIGDKAGMYSASVSTTVLLDTADPVVNSTVVKTTGGTPLTTGATIADNRVVLATSVTDLSLALMMQVSTTGSFAGAVWEAYNPNKTVDLPPGASTLAARVRDEAGHITDLIASFSLTVDSTPPTSPSLGINNKIGGAVSTATVSVTLSAGDGPVDAEIAYDPGFVTSLGSFAPNATHNVALPAGDGSKSLYVRFFDAAGNASALAGDTVVLDTTPPIASFVIFDVGPTKISPLTLSYTQAGATNFRTVEDAACGGALEPVGAGSKSLAVSASEGLKDVRMQFFDAVGNASACLVQSVYYDPNPPVVGTLQINYGQAATSSNVVTLSFPGVSGATKVMVSEDAGFVGADWQSFAATKTYTLSAGNGVKTVYAKVGDDAAHVVNLPQQTITLDTTPPTSPSIFAAYEVTSQTAVPLFLSAGLVSEMWITQDDPTFTTGAWEVYAGSKLFALSGTDGAKTIYAKFKKSTGVETAVVSDSVILDRTAPILPAVRINNGAVVVTSNIVTLGLSAVDSASGLYTYKVNTTNDFSAVSPKPFQPTDVFSFTPVDGLKTVWVTIGDRAGLYSAPVSASVLLDTTPPSAGSVAVTKLDGTPLSAGNAVTENRVILSSSVADASGLEMQVTTNGSYVGTTWVPYEPNKVIDLVSGSPSISARVRDGAGLVTNLVSAFTLTVDTLAPVLTVTRTSPSPTSSLIVALTLSASEPSQSQISIDPNFGAAVWFATAATTVAVTPGDGLHTLYVRARDLAGNLSTVQNVSVIIDTVAPSGAVLVNQGAAATVTNVVTLTLTGVDTGSGVNGVKLASTQAQLAAAALLPLEATKLWTLGGAAGVGVDEIKAVWMQVFDNAGLASTPVSDTIRFDRKIPVGSITLPGAVTSATLVGVDLTFDADVALMKISAGNSCSGGNWVGAANESLFELTPLDGPQSVSVRFRDQVGNDSACYFANITLDRQGPAPALFTATGTGSPLPPAGYSKSNSVRLDWNTSAADCNLVQISEDIGFLTVDYVNPDCTSAFVAAFGFSPAFDGVHTVYMRMRDTVGNWGPLASVVVIVDTSVPSALGGGFTIAQGAFTNTQTITLDHLSTGATKYRVVEDWGCTGSFVPLAPSTSFGISGGDGLKPVSVQYADDANNVTACFTNTVTLDTVIDGMPAATLTIDSGALKTNVPTVSVLVDYADADVAAMQISNLPMVPDALSQPFASPFAWVLPAGDGAKTIYVKLLDPAGNSTIISATIELDTTPPNPPALQVVDVTGDGFALSNSSVELGWSASVAPDIASYELQRFVGSVDSDFGIIATFAPGTNIYTDNLVNTTGYTHNYRIRAVDDIGNVSEYSNIADAAPFAPIDQVCGVGSGVNKYTLHWKPNPGMFNVKPKLYSYNVTGASSINELFDNTVQTDFTAYDWSTGAFDPSAQLTMNNQDNSLVYRANYALPGATRVVLDSAGTVGTSPSLAFDASGDAHVVYGQSPGGFKYKRQVNGVWTAPVVVGPTNSSTWVSLALDSAGKAHVSYYAGTGNTLNYATNQSGSWVLTPIDTTLWVGLYNSVAVDGAGKVHISYRDQNKKDLKYATNASGSWVTTAVDATGDVGTYTSIAVDSTNKPHIVYIDETNLKTKYATNTSGAWVLSTLPAPTPAGWYHDFVLDPANKAHISYFSNVAGDLRYVTNVSGAWVDTLIDAPNNVGMGNSIARDSAGKIHISYYDVTKQSLKYITNASGSWVPLTLDATADVGSENSIALDAAQKPHIAYVDTTNGDLKYASNFSGAWSVTALLTSVDIGRDISLHISAAGKSYLSYFDYTYGELEYMTNESGTWSAPVVIDAGLTTFANSTSLRRDAAGKIHVSYYDNTNKDLMYATNASGAWVTTIVDPSTDLMYASTSLVLDAAGKVHISYYNALVQDLKYATNASGAWVLSALDQTGLVGSYSSMATDSAGKLHVSYYDNTNGNLKYLTNKTGAWVATVVDSGGDVGMYTSLAVDSSNFVHISYYDNTNKNLKYATNVSGAWITQVADSEGDVGWNTSMSLSTNGEPRIAYYDYTNSAMKFAFSSQGTWISSIVDNAADVGRYASLAFDNQGDAHVAYFDYSNRDLKYTEFQYFCGPAMQTQLIGPFD